MFENSGAVAVLDPSGGAGSGFSRGPAWSTYLPDGMLADLLEQGSRQASQWERLERIGAWERVVSWAQANQVREMARFAENAERDAVRRRSESLSGSADELPGPEVAQVSAQESAAAEFSLMLRVAPVTAASRLAEAQDLTARLPQVVALLAAGRITLSKARIIAEQTAQLSDAHAAAVVGRVLERAATQTPGQLRRAVRRAVARTDPGAVRRRHEAATRERGVSFWELPDGMAMVSACLPAGEAIGVYGVLDEYARATGGPDEERTLAARRADALVDLVCRPAGYTSTGTRAADDRRSRRDRRRSWRRQSRVRVQVRVTVPFSTLFGLDEQPGELAGYGPITAEQARELAAQGTWRRILTDPATGQPVDYGTTVYRPPAALRDLILTRTPTCTFPSCLNPAHRGDLDHREPFDQASGTGPTRAGNLDPYCRHHHRTKQTEGWSVTCDEHGMIIWTTPSGHTWRHEPAPLGEPPPQPPPKPPGPPVPPPPPPVLPEAPPF